MARCFFCNSLFLKHYLVLLVWHGIWIAKIMKQTTLRKEIKCSGIGLHSGQKVEMVLKPASADSGIVFALQGPAGRKLIAPTPSGVVGTGLATTLGSGDAKVSTVEHLLAALVGLEVDNVLIEVQGEEIPILDGSAAVYVFLINSVGLKQLDRPRRIAKITCPLVFEHDGKCISVKPYNGLRIDYTIDFRHPLIGEQKFSYLASPVNFAADIARARTFGFLRDVEWLQKNGLALGGSLENAVVFDEYGIVNPEGLRFGDEMVRHKILDFLGDIAMGPHRLWGHFTVSCSGHDFNNQFMRYLFDHAASCIEVVSLGAVHGASKRPEPEYFPAGSPVWA